jgi:hypothetical protein
MKNYRKMYDSLINKARINAVQYERGYEVHHIVPRSLGGGDEPRNLVNLWPKEHLRAHWLLAKFLLGSERLKMERVFERMLLSKTANPAFTFNKQAIRRDALDDAKTYGAMPSNKRFRKEGLAKAATKFLASEATRRGSRPLTKH